MIISNRSEELIIQLQEDYTTLSGMVYSNFKSRNNSESNKKDCASLTCPEGMNQICVDIGDIVTAYDFGLEGVGVSAEINIQ